MEKATEQAAMIAVMKGLIIRIGLAGSPLARDGGLGPTAT
jgi:hypothetical protein